MLVDPLEKEYGNAYGLIMHMVMHIILLWKKYGNAYGIAYILVMHMEMYMR